MTRFISRPNITKLLALLFFFVAKPVFAFTPTAYQARYQVSLGGIALGEMERGLSIQQNHYRLVLKTLSSIPLYSYESMEKSEGPLPSLHAQSNCFTQILDQKSTHWCANDQAIQQLVQQTSSRSIRPVYDELNYQLAMQQDLHKQKHKFEYWLITDGKLKQYLFKIVGHERIHTPIGWVKTTKLQRINGGKRTTTLWLADDYEYLPIAFNQTRPNRPAVQGMIIRLIWKDKSVKL